MNALRAGGALGLLGVRLIFALPRMNGREYLRALYLFGVRSIPIAFITAAVIGGMVVLQTGLYTERFGARAFLGWAAGYAVLWEFGPLLLGLMMNARVGARNAAELASLKIGGQIEGLSGISLDPMAVLVAPRILALVVSITLLAVPSFLLAIGCEILAAVWTLDLPPRVFVDNFASMIGPGVLLAGLLKTFSYAWAVALISTAVGLRAEGGAKAVGHAAAAAVVWGAGAIFTLDFALSSLLGRLWSAG